MKYFYGILCILGTAFPYASFIPWLVENGFNIGLILSEIRGDQISSFAWRDVFISAIALITFILAEGKYQKMKHLWAPIAGTCLVGVSLGLPLFLLMRQIHIEANKP